MAASYSTDLTTLSANETNAMVEPTATTPESWVNLNAFASAETDYFIQGVACTSATMKVGVGGALTNNISFTMGTEDSVLCWAYYWAPGGMDSEANGGVRQMIGSGTAAFWWVTQSGAEDWIYGGWRCYAMGRPDLITVNTVGTPTTSYAYTGWAAKLLTVPGKGNPFGVDAVRKGRGQIKVTGSTATFTEVEEFNSKNSTAARTGFTLLDSGYHRLGLFQYQNGSYLWKGKLLLGETGVTSCGFTDSNKAILVENTKNVVANFNLIEVQHASSVISWSGISMQSLGIVSKGRFLATDSATITMSTCSFTDMDTFVFNAATNANTITDTTWRRCGQVTGNAATFTGCVFDKATSAVSVRVADLAKLSKCQFTSDASNHAVELTSVGSGNMTWDNTLTSYLAGSTGSPVTPTSTGNEAIYVNVGTGTLTISVAAGATVPSIRSAGATVNVSSGSVTIKAKAVTEAGVAVSGARIHIEAIAGGPFPVDVTVTIVNSGTTATVTHTGHNMATNDKVVIRGASLDANNGVFPITKISVDSYSYTMASTPGSSPTGTIKSTFVIMNDITDGTGFNTTSVSRVYSSAQPVTGRIRKSSTAPFYKNAAISGTVSSSVDTTFTAVMISDD